METVLLRHLFNESGQRVWEGERLVCAEIWWWIFMTTEKWYGGVLRWATERLCVHCQRMGSILWISLCQAADHLRWCQPPQEHDRLLVEVCPESDDQTDEGNAHRPCDHPELVLCQERSAQVSFQTSLHFTSRHELLIHFMTFFAGALFSWARRGVFFLSYHLCLCADLWLACKSRWQSKTRLRISRPMASRYLPELLTNLSAWSSLN